MLMQEYVNMFMKKQRRGLTLIELLVVIFIVGALLALILPAAQQARESARRMHCASQLKGIGVALHQHVSVHGTFPAGDGDRLGESYIVPLLPYMEQQALYDSLDLAVDSTPLVNSADGQAIDHPPPTFRCPSDPPPDWSLAYSAVSYPANAGRGPVMVSDGPFTHGSLRPGEIGDGLSQTVGITEWVVGSGTIGVPGSRDHADRLGSVHSITPPLEMGQHERFLRLCESLPPDRSKANHPGFKGMRWTMGGGGMTQYNHELPPNRPSCTGYPWTDAISAGSFHGGGANSLAMDGSVRFVSDSVDRRVWAAVGTRSGGEIVDGEARD